MGDARRIKRVKPIANALKKLVTLAPVEFKHKDGDGDFSSGFISQDLAKVFPQFVSKPKGDNGSDAIGDEKPDAPRGWIVPTFGVLVPWIVSAVQEVNDELDKLRRRVNKRIEDVDAKFVAVETRVVDLESQLAALKTTIDNLGANP